MNTLMWVPVVDRPGAYPRDFLCGEYVQLAHPMLPGTYATAIVRERARGGIMLLVELQGAVDVTGVPSLWFVVP